MSRQHRPWYGRPNKPPENWYKPHEPAIRRVTGESEDASQDSSPFRTIEFPTSVWLNILRALYLYESKHGTAEWVEWRLALRGIILEKAKPVSGVDRHISITFTLDNWRRIWQALKIVVRGRDVSWRRWFRWVSAEMTRQIMQQENRS